MGIIRSYTRKKWSRAGVIGLAVVAVIAVIGIIVCYREWRAGQLKIDMLEEQVKSLQRVVYVAAKKLPGGTVLTEENIRQEIRYMDIRQEQLITEEALGRAVTFDVEEGSCLMMTMLCPVKEAGRELFLSEVSIPEYLVPGDRVDVRIRYENAEDYIVLADKILVRCDPEKGMVLEVTEEELLLLSSAITDKKRYAGTKLYAVRYPEYEYAEKGKITYIANKEILMLMGRENTEGESRAALERRLMQNQNQ